ncbi:MAG: hypothetical protein KC621_27630 [Myxococcales bacterium]|nr:hypothetical protein [Myxococcales bacterium]
MARAARISAGIGLLAAGAAMLVLPGPGLLTIAAGAAMLERDIPLVRRWTDRVRGLLPGAVTA